MKTKIFTLLALSMLIFSTANAQYKLTPNGLINDTKKDFIVLDYENKTQTELYNAVYMLLNSMYVNPQKVLSTVDNNSISINGISTNAIYRKKDMSWLISTFDINYTISLQFKDNKIRINNPSINNMNVAGMPYETFYTSKIFNKKGETGKKYKDTKISIESFFNDYIKKIDESIKDNKATNW